jgi:hypothetical protein
MKEEVVDGPDAAHRAPFWLRPTPRAILTIGWGLLGQHPEPNRRAKNAAGARQFWSHLLRYIASLNLPRAPQTISPECTSASGTSACPRRMQWEQLRRGVEDGSVATGGGT